MIIKISDVPSSGGSYSGEDPASILEIEGSKDMRAEGPVRYSFHVQVVSDELIVDGRLSVAMSFRCSRCGETFSSVVEDRSFQCARETEMDESVDLTGEMREAIILAFPNYPVCRPDCKGLCAQCGASLNSEKCNCKPSGENAWAALDNLKLR
jgi:uncharacterized protein